MWMPQGHRNLDKTLVKLLWMKISDTIGIYSIRIEVPIGVLHISDVNGTVLELGG